MKKNASIIIATVMLALCFALSACGDKYISNCRAEFMVEEKTENKASISFDNFRGTYVVKLTNNGNNEVFVTYDAKLGKGNIKVYYDYNGEKLSLFEIGTDGSVEGKTEAFTSNKPIYIIIESAGRVVLGSFSFALKESEK